MKHKGTIVIHRDAHLMYYTQFKKKLNEWSSLYPVLNTFKVMTEYPSDEYLKTNSEVIIVRLVESKEQPTGLSQYAIWAVEIWTQLEYAETLILRRIIPSIATSVEGNGIRIVPNIGLPVEIEDQYPSFGVFPTGYVNAEIAKDPTLP